MIKGNRNKFRVVCQIILISAVFLAAIYAEAKQIRVAVLDTGINMYLHNKLPICGVKDFTGLGILDNYGHGNHVAAIIGDRAGKANYCLLIVKYFDKNITSSQAAINSIQALKYILEQNVDILNYSGGGKYPMQEEKELILKLLDKGVIINAAAGNESKQLTETSGFYPASYDRRINVVESLDKDGNRLGSSNWGEIVDFSRLGKIEIEIGPDTFSSLEGTSQATAVFTGEMIRDKSKETTSGRSNQTRTGSSVRRTN